jgi:hypothetical protein
VNEENVREVCMLLRRTAKQLTYAMVEARSGQNDGWTVEYYRDTITRLRENLCIQLDKIPRGESTEQLDMFDKENV